MLIVPTLSMTVEKPLKFPDKRLQAKIGDILKWFPGKLLLEVSSVCRCFGVGEMKVKPRD